MGFSLDIDQTTLARTGDITLVEAICEHPVLTADIALVGKGQAGADLVGRRVRLEHRPRGGRAVLLFDGLVTEARFDDAAGCGSIGCTGHSIRFDLASDTCSFAAAGADPVALRDLPGFRSAFEFAGALETLDAPVLAVTQFEESPWHALLRFAAWSRACVLSRAGVVSVLREPTGETKSIEEWEILPGSFRTLSRLRLVDHAVSSRDRRTGQIPGEASRSAGEAPGSDALRALMARGRAAAHAPAHGSFRHEPPAPSNHERAAALASARATGMLEYSIALLTPSVGYGDRIQLPASCNAGGPLLVRRRTLTFRPGVQQAQLVNELVCEAATTFAPDATMLESSAGERTLEAQVIDVPTGFDRPLVRVRPPWGAEGNGDAGLLCEVGQSFHGAQGGVHGGLVMPRPGDWVRLRFEPHAVTLPLVECAVAHANNRLPQERFDPAKDVVLASTAGGLVLALREANDELVLAIAPQGALDKPACVIRLLKQAPDAQGPVVVVEAKDGTIILRATHLAVHASDKMEVHTPRLDVTS